LRASLQVAGDRARLTNTGETTLPQTDPTTTRALRAIHGQRPLRIHPPQLVNLIQNRLVTLDEHGTITLTKRGQHTLHTADTHAKSNQRLPALATALAPAAHELAPAINTLHGDRSPKSIETHAPALATLVSIARHLWTSDERELLRHLSNNPEKLATTAKRLGWDGKRAHKTFDRILTHSMAALKTAPHA